MNIASRNIKNFAMVFHWSFAVILLIYTAFYPAGRYQELTETMAAAEAGAEALILHGGRENLEQLTAEEIDRTVKANPQKAYGLERPHRTLRLERFSYRVERVIDENLKDRLRVTVTTRTPKRGGAERVTSKTPFLATFSALAPAVGDNVQTIEKIEVLWHNAYLDDLWTQMKNNPGVGGVGRLVDWYARWFTQ